MNTPVARRDLLRRTGLLAGVLAGGALLAAYSTGQRPPGAIMRTPALSATPDLPALPRAIDRLTP